MRTIAHAIHAAKQAWARLIRPLRIGCRWFFGQTWIALVAVSLALPGLFMLPLLVKWLGRDFERPAVQEIRTATWAATALDGQLVFSDVTAQSREFIGYYHTIQLTPEQEAIKATVLEAMPAACCNGSTAYTCCCPCNLSKTLWGLSNYLITERDVSKAQLAEAVYTWLNYTNPRGYTGDACYRGACEGQFHSNGRGGMDETKLTV
jgi:hypothetical protein